MKLRLFIGISAALALVGCGFVHSGSSINRKAAKEVSESFMGDLVVNHVDAAVNKMEPKFIQATGRTQADAAIRKLFDYCGRPLDSEFKHDEVGLRINANGRTQPMRKFYYAATTTQYPKGKCFFSVAVVSDDGELKVATFGPLKLLSGQLPDWLH